MTSADDWIQKLNLVPHPEGGFYRETYRASEELLAPSLPPRFGGNRSFSTAIYFLLSGQDFSALHRIKSDEVWHFYDGGTLLVHVLSSQGEVKVIKLGRNINAGEVPQAVVKAGDWFGSELQDKSSFALVGCTVAPGFDFDDFEMGERESLTKEYLSHQELIKRMTRS